MGEAVRLVQLEGQVNRLIRVIHIHGNFVIIGNVNAFNGLLYGKLTELYYRAMLDILSTICLVRVDCAKQIVDNILIVSAKDFFV